MCICSGWRQSVAARTRSLHRRQRAHRHLPLRQVADGGSTDRPPGRRLRRPGHGQVLLAIRLPPILAQTGRSIRWSGNSMFFHCPTLLSVLSASLQSFKARVNSQHKSWHTSRKAPLIRKVLSRRHDVVKIVSNEKVKIPTCRNGSNVLHQVVAVHSTRHDYCK